MKNQITGGKWRVSKSGNPAFKKCVTTDIDGGSVCFMSNWPEHEANGELVAEAGTVTNESGFTPRELLTQRESLLDAFKVIWHKQVLGIEPDAGDYLMIRNEIKKIEPDYFKPIKRIPQ